MKFDEADSPDLITRIWLLREAKAKVEKELEQLEADLIAEMETNQRKTVSSGKYQATYVRRTTVEVDEEGLRKAMGAKVFDKYTDSKLNRKKLEKALEDGEVDVSVVSPYVSEKHGAAHLRWTEKKNDQAHA